MIKNVSLDFSSERLFETAEKLIDVRNYTGALKIINKNCALNGDDAYSHLLYAQIFDDMGLFERSINEWFKFLSRSEYLGEDDLCDAYEGLAVAYMNIGDEKFSAYYYNKLLQNSSDVDEGMKLDIMDSFLSREENPLKFVYPPELADCSDTLAEGVALMKAGEFERAIKEFSKIDCRNKAYSAARNYVAMCYIIEDKYDQAEKVCLALLETNPCDVHALTTLAAVKTEQKEFDESKKLAERLLKSDPDSPDDIFKIATVCCENSMHAEAFGLFKKLSKMLPYDSSVLYFKAISAFNSGDFNECFTAFDTLITLNPDAVTARYYREAARIAVKKGDTQPMSYFYRLPANERESSVKILAAVGSLSRAQIKKAFKEVDISDCVRWCFDENEGSGNFELQYLGAVCAVKGGLDGLVSDILLNAFVADELKIKILTLIGGQNEERDISVVICNVLKEFRFNKLELGRAKRKTFVEAYASLTAHFALIDERFSDKFAAVTEGMYDALAAEDRLGVVTSLSELSCAIFLGSKLKLPRMTKRSDVCKYFEVDGNKIFEKYGV